MPTATISVIVPCHNAERWLPEAIASVRAQSRPATEVIVVDDHSTDSSLEVARSLGVAVLTVPRNGGASAARNVGISAARGELLAFLDADDAWFPEHLAVVGGLLERHPESPLAFAPMRMFGDAEWTWPTILPPEVPTDARSACLQRCIALPSATIVRREALLAVGGFDERLRVAEDFDLSLRLSYTGPFVCASQVTGRRRMHGAQTGADQHRYWGCEYQSRWRLHAAREATAPDEGAALAAAIRDVWLGHLRRAWWARSLPDFDFHLAQAPSVPGARALLPRLRRRRVMLPMLRVWDALPAPFRAGVSRVARPGAAWGR